MQEDESHFRKVIGKGGIGFITEYEFPEDNWIKQYRIPREIDY